MSVTESITVKHDGPCGKPGCHALVGHYHPADFLGYASAVSNPAMSGPVQGRLGTPTPEFLRRSSLPTDDKSRKALPIFDGVLMYFPDAIAAVAHVSKLGNDQHNPGEPLRWAREKSTDQMNTAMRHMIDHGTGNQKDIDGSWHLAKAIWRLCAELQLTIEKERG